MKDNPGQVHGTIRIGTSGIALPGSKQTFPGEFRTGSRLRYYGSLFNTLEVNSSFHKIPLPSTFAKWSQEVPENFRFTVKLWRGITHAKKLAYAADDLEVFMHAARQLGEKKGCLLLQFPASIRFEYLQEVEDILSRLQHLDPDGQWKPAVELRHPGWYNEQTYSMLGRYNASLVFHDIAASRTPMTNPATDIIYLRLHGPQGDYRGSYPDKVLRDYAVWLRNCMEAGKDVYVYFNNTMGEAYQNAQSLQGLLL